MRIGAAFPSKYLKAADLPADRHVSVVIDHVTVENVAGNDNPDDEKPVLYFQGKQKGMVLNKTNATTISNAYGDETDAWSGQPILLYVTDVAFQGKMVPSIRVKVDRAAGRATGTGNGTNAPVRRTAAAPAQAPAEAIPFGTDQAADEIPDF
jgi:hypothetical protein